VRTSTRRSKASGPDPQFANVIQAVSGGRDNGRPRRASGALSVNVADSQAVARYRLNISVNIQNLFNRPTYSGNSGVLTSPTFLQPTSASGVRRTTINMNLTF
jgi:hypothetical protein